MKNIEFYIKGLFRNIERTPEISDQIEELSCHISDRVHDLCSSGMSEEEALEKTIQGLGNLDELIDTITGKKVRLPMNKINMIMTLAGTLYGALYLSFVTISMWEWYMGPPALYLTGSAFAGYVIPFVFALIRYCMFPNKTVLLPVPSSKPVLVSIAGWILISVICIIANFFMYKALPQSNFWSWMPAAGVFTWPLMEFVMFSISKNEAKKDQGDAF